MSVESEKEEWRDIEMLGGVYQISNLGRIKSLNHYVKHPKGGFALKKARVIKTARSKKTGYEQFRISYKGIIVSGLVHRLVVCAFPEICGETFDGYEVDHINTIRNDNRAENLRVCTRHENHMNPITRVRYRNMNKGKKLNRTPWNKGKKLPNFSGANHPKSKTILQFTKDGVFVKRWENTSIAGDTLRISKTSITNCLTGRSKSANKFIWKYETEV